MNRSKTDLSAISAKVDNVVNQLEQMGLKFNNAQGSDKTKETQLLNAFRALDQAGRENLLSSAQSLVDKQKENVKQLINWAEFEARMQADAAQKYY